MAVNSPIVSAVSQGINSSICGSGAAAATPLLTDMTAYCDLSEVSGTRSDSHTNGYNLTDNNTVTQAAGVGGGQNSAQFTGGNSEWLDNVNAVWDFGDVNLSIGFWIYADTLTSNKGLINIKGDSGEVYRLDHNTTTLRWFLFKASGNHSVTKTITTATWYYVQVYHSADNNEIGIALDDGAFTTAATTGAPKATGTNPKIEFGRLASNYWNGRQQAAGIWVREMLASEWTWLYNGGTAARLYADVAAYTG